MKWNSTKGKMSFFENKPIIATILIAIFLLAFVFLDNYPSLQPMRDNWIYTVISKVLISSVVLSFTWFSRKKPARFEQILISSFALLPWMPLLIKSHRVILLMQMVLFVVLLVVFIKHFMSDKKYSAITNAVSLFLGMIVIMAVKEYTFIRNSNGIHFWQIALVAAVMITAVFTIFLIKNKIRLEDNGISERVMAPILVFGISFILIAFLVSNLNYALDFSKPTEYTTSILEKRIDTGYRSPTDYVFTANVKGEEKEFNVYRSEYFYKEVGDSFSVLLYSGAFGDEYYMYDYIK